MDKSADDKIRPSGVPAVVFDGGIIYLMIIFVCALNSVLQFLSYYLNNLISLKISFYMDGCYSQQPISSVYYKYD